MFKMCANLYNYRSAQRPVILFMGIKEIDKGIYSSKVQKIPSKVLKFIRQVWSCSQEAVSRSGYRLEVGGNNKSGSVEKLKNVSKSSCREIT